MNIKLHYGLLFAGCVSYAGLLSFIHGQYLTHAPTMPSAPAVLVNLTLGISTLLWPGWIFIFWKFGLKETLAERIFWTVFPVFLSLVIMREVVLYVLFILCLMIFGFRT